MATSDAQNTGMDCNCHYNSIMFPIINILNYHIVILALLLLEVVLIVVEYMWFLSPVVLQLQLQQCQQRYYGV